MLFSNESLESKFILCCTMIDKNVFLVLII